VTSDDAERRSARIAFVGALVVIAAFVAGKAARDAILLANFPVDNLPLFIGASAVMSLPVIVVAGRLFVRYGPHRLVPLLNVYSATLLGGEWLLLQQHPRIAAVIVFLHLGSLGAVLVSGFWSIVNERFDIQSAKRYAGRIGLGATLGGVIGGVIAERTAVHLAPDMILIVLAGIQLLCAAALSALGRGALLRRGSEDEVARLSVVRVIGRNALLRNLGIVIVLCAVSAAALDFVFKVELVAAAEDDPLRLFALYHAATSIITALVQLLLAPAVLLRLGVARSVLTLPIAVTGFGLLAIAVPGLVSAAIARGAEAVTRSSVYRGGYELLFTALPERDKRSAKVVLDVGAERIGDLLGALLIAVLVYLAFDPRVPVLGAALGMSVLALMFASRVPGNYTRALEQSLVDRAKSGGLEAPSDSLRWTSFGAVSMSDTGAHQSMMSLLELRSERVREIVGGAPRRPSQPVLPPAVTGDPVLDSIAALRTRDAKRIRAVLAGGVPPALVSHVIPLLAWNEVARDVQAALVAVAARNTGALVDVLLDHEQEFTIRRRLPVILVSGERELAAWGLLRGLGDPRFEVRYRCGRALVQLRSRGHTLAIEEVAVHQLVDRELQAGPEVMNTYRLIDDDQDNAELALAVILPVSHASPTALAHIFNLLGLALPAEPIRIAYQGLHTQDRELRATALEYLESALPADLAARLWPLIEREPMPRPKPRSRDELTAALKLSQPAIEAKLAKLRETR